MSKTSFINEFVEQASELVEQASKILPSASSREELQKIINLLIQSALGKLDLVSREEFDAQRAVLQASRKKLEELETQLRTLQEELAAIEQKQ